MTSPLDLITNTKRIQILEELLAEAYADADEVLRPRIAQLETKLSLYENLTQEYGLSAFSDISEAVAEEREACAKVCDELHHKWNWGNDEPISGPSECAAAIRARSKEQ